MNRVTRGYLLIEGSNAQRVLVDSKGRVFTGRDWEERPTGRVQRAGHEYERWQDVPQSWLGFSPYWSTVLG